MRARPNHIRQKRYGPLVLGSENVDFEGTPTPHMVIRHPRRGVVIKVMDTTVADLLLPSGNPEHTRAAHDQLCLYVERLFGVLLKRDYRLLIDAMVNYYPELLNVKPPADGPDEQLKQMARDQVVVKADGKPVGFLH